MRFSLLIFAGIHFWITVPPLAAQSAGERIYFTERDLAVSKTTTPAFRLRAHTVFYKTYVQVRLADSVYCIAKDSLYGYRNRQGVSYRFFGKDVYEILNPGEKIALYRVRAYVQAKGSVVQEKYYFSTDFKAPVQELTLTNLKKSFAANKAFYELLEARSGKTELWAYDSNFHMYVLNRIWANSLSMPVRTD